MKFWTWVPSSQFWMKQGILIISYFTWKKLHMIFFSFHFLRGGLPQWIYCFASRRFRHKVTRKIHIMYINHSSCTEYLKVFHNWETKIYDKDTFLNFTFIFIHELFKLKVNINNISIIRSVNKFVEWFYCTFKYEESSAEWWNAAFALIGLCLQLQYCGWHVCPRYI